MNPVALGKAHKDVRMSDLTQVAFLDELLRDEER